MTAARRVDIWFTTCICHRDSSKVVVDSSVSETRVVESGSILTCWITTMWHCWISTMSPQENDIIQGHYEEKKVEYNGYNLSGNAHTKKKLVCHTCQLCGYPCHGLNSLLTILTVYISKINLKLILPSPSKSSKWLPCISYQNQNSTCISFCPISGIKQS